MIFSPISPSRMETLFPSAFAAGWRACYTVLIIFAGGSAAHVNAASSYSSLGQLSVPVHH
jgi:hypothetical protein